MGGFKNEEDCQDECVDGLGCLLCVPGAIKCNNDDAELCNDDGDLWEHHEYCDPVQDLECIDDVGCAGECAKENLGETYIGCDYYPTVSPNYPGYESNPHEFAVAVSNTTNNAADITVTQGNNMIAQAQVAAGAVQTIALPWHDQLKLMNGPTKLEVDGAYRLRSTQPVTVYQYNPIASTVTNDASLLLPVNSLRGEVMAVAWPSWPNIGRPGFYSITATEDDTTVDLSPSASGSNVMAGAGVQANGTGQINLDRGDVLQVFSADVNGADVTGTIATADKPIMMLGGHPCTNVPFQTSACDHLEEMMFPLEAVAKKYVVVPPVQVPNDNLEKAQIVYIVATEDDTDITYDPPQNGAPANLANAGDYAALAQSTEAYVVEGDKKIMVSQYMIGQSGGFGTSDPAMLLAVGTEQYRDTYLFHAPPSWTANYVDIIAPDGAQVDVDNQAVNGWIAVGATGWVYAHVQLNNNGNGNHTVDADEPVGISVSGVQQYGSYWYAGGSDLKLIPQ
jgi:hypothetical protein